MRVQKAGALFLALLLCVSLGGCGTTGQQAGSVQTSAPTHAAVNYDGSYVGMSSGFGGDVRVTLNVEANKVTGILAEGSEETEGIGAKAITSYNDDLFTSLIGMETSSLESVSVDAVSGATVTSTAVQNAFSLAVDKALKKVAEQAALADYEGTFSVYGNNYSLPFTVSVKTGDGKLQKIAVTDAGGETPSILQTVIDRLIPRILSSQSLAVDAISGATASSNGVKNAVSQAIDAAGGDSAQWYTPVDKSTSTVKLEGYDVIVVGLGGSGLASYISAAEQGAAVFGIEKAGKIGGTSTLVGGLMSVNPQNETVKPDVPTDAQALYDTWMKDAEDDAKSDVVKMLIEQSGSTLDWLVEKWDFQLGKVGPFMGQWQIYSTYAGDTEQMYLNAIEKAKKMNPKSDYMLELTAQELILDTQGVIAGVRATSYDGTIYEIHAPTVILATGGYAGSAEMTTGYLGHPLSLYGMYQNDGAGIRLALSANGATYNISVPAMQHVSRTPLVIHDDRLSASDTKALYNMVSVANVLAVDSTGKRFVNENEGMGLSEVSWKAGEYFYTLYSQDDIDRIKVQGFDAVNMMLNVQDFTVSMAAMQQAASGAASSPAPDTSKVLLGNVPIANIDTALEVGMDNGVVFKADTLEQLSQQMDMPDLEQTVNEYNSFAQGEKADPFRKDISLIQEIAPEGPYYLIKGTGFPYTTCGGLDVDTNINVLDTTGNPIAGLYAVGTDSLGVLLTEKKAYFDYGGVAHGWCFVSGKIAGANAASFSKAQ